MCFTECSISIISTVISDKNIHKCIFEITVASNILVTLWERSQFSEIQIQNPSHARSSNKYPSVAVLSPILTKPAPICLVIYKKQNSAMARFLFFHSATISKAGNEEACFQHFSCSLLSTEHLCSTLAPS